MMMSFALLPRHFCVRSVLYFVRWCDYKYGSILLYRNSRDFFSGVATSRSTRCLAWELSTVVAFFDNSRSMLRWFVSVFISETYVLRLALSSSFICPE